MLRQAYSKAKKRGLNELANYMRIHVGVSGSDYDSLQLKSELRININKTNFMRHYGLPLFPVPVLCTEYAATIPQIEKRRKSDFSIYTK